MKITKFTAFILFISFSVQCSAQKNDEPWLKRNWNNMIARYNIYFNANQKLEKATKQLADKQDDDFQKYLDVYPYGTKEDAKEMRSSMEEVMKKASKVIQSKPKSKWVDNSYFIIGQTHFFGGDYYAAIEAFQFVNSNYTDPHIKALSQLWLMKSYIRQEKYNDAEAIFGLLREIKISDREFETHLNLSGGNLLVKQEKYNDAIPYLVNGLEKLKNKEVKYRTNFVLGQLYLNAEKYKKANEHFIKVLKLNAPYEYVFQANIGMARATARAGGTGSRNTKKYLRRMLDDDKNIEYFDQIYYELALLEFGGGNEQAGLDYMLQSSSSSKNNQSQQTKTYLYLADYYFAQRNYDKAQAYYDSTVAVLPQDFPEGEKIKAQHSVLSKLIENIETIKLQDSLLALSNLDRDVLDKKISEIIAAEQEKERIAKEEALIRQEQERLNPGGNNLPLPGGGNAGGGWYFYNPTTVSRGSNDFIKVWGSRKKGDWWRFINKSVVEAAVPKQQQKDEDEDSDPDTYSTSTDKEQKEALKNLDQERLKYYEPIPFSETAKQVAHNKIQDAYLGIGKIYFDDLKEFLKSKSNLNILLSKYPETTHKPEALFYLAKSELQLGDSGKYDEYAKQIAEDYPETAYNKVLNAKEIVEDSKDKEVVALYSKMYNSYTANNFYEVLKYKAEIDTKYPGNSIQGKIDYLFALTIGKTKGKAEYLKELEVLKEAYTGTEVGEMAAFTIRLLTEGEESANVEKTIFSSDITGKHFYVIIGKTKKESEVKVALDNYNKEFFGSKTLQISNLIFANKQLFYLKQFGDKKEAMKYHVDMITSQSMLTEAGLSDQMLFCITEANFKTLVKNKNETDYFRFFIKNYN